MMNTVLKCHNAYKMGAIYLYWYSDWKKMSQFMFEISQH